MSAFIWIHHRCSPDKLKPLSRFLWVSPLHSVYSKTILCYSNIVKRLPVCVCMIQLQPALSFQQAFMKLHTGVAASYYRVVQGFISWFPKEKHSKNVSSYLDSSSSYKATREAQTTMFLRFLFVYIVLVSLTGCQHRTFVFFSKALEEAVTEGSKKYHLQKLLFCLCFHVMCSFQDISLRKDFELCFFFFFVIWHKWCFVLLPVLWLYGYILCTVVGKMGQLSVCVQVRCCNADHPEWKCKWHSCGFSCWRHTLACIQLLYLYSSFMVWNVCMHLDAQLTLYYYCVFRSVY